ncbi:hypothetical protein [Microvirga sesbaniae]|uniref:hypothetical protein n=1 Tax=Microvirga sesbaniae TaxID=681392 RepID=UPI0021C68842|nr:hypothetical protein [Microvirga sp. HBU67692]
MRRSLLLVQLALVVLALPIEMPRAEKRHSLKEAGSIRYLELVPTGQTALAALAVQKPNTSLSEILSKAGDAEISNLLEDLNSDGTPELIVQLTGTITCGIRDCDTYIFSLENNEYRPIWTATMSVLGVGSVNVNGWNILVTNPDTQKDNGTFWSWEGKNYVLR